MRVAGVGQEAEVARVGRERDQSGGVGRRGGDDVDHLHVPDVVDVETLLEADHQPASVHSNGSDLVVVGVAADLSPLLEMAHPEGPVMYTGYSIITPDVVLLPGVGGGHHRHEAGAEQPLRDVDVRLLVPVHQVHGVRGVDAVQAVAPSRAHRYASEIVNCHL